MKNPQLLSLLALAFLACNAESAQVVLDFERAALGEFSSDLIVPDGLGGHFIVSPTDNSGSTYSIVDKDGDSELRHVDSGEQTGSNTTTISHSLGPVRSRSLNYEADPGRAIGSVTITGTGEAFFDSLPQLSTQIDTAVSLAGSLTNSLRISSNGSTGPRIAQVDFDDFVFEVDALFFVEDERYAQQADSGFSSFALRADSMTDWRSTRMEVRLDSGSVGRDDVPGSVGLGVPPSLGDTGVFAPLFDLGNLSAASGSVFVTEYVESDSLFVASWQNSGEEIGQFDLATVSLSSDANGEITLENTVAGLFNLGFTGEQTWEIRNGRIVPEPSASTQILAVVLFVGAMMRSRQGREKTSWRRGFTTSPFFRKP